MQLNNITLGKLVRDVVTGYKGTAITKVEMLGGNVQFCVQPAGDLELEGRNFPDAMNIDFHGLELVSDAKTVVEPTSPIPVTIQLGDEVEDTVTGLKGIATVRHTYINGCIYYSVQQRAMTDKQTGVVGVLDPHHLNQARLVVVKPLVAPVADAKPTTAGRIPGGPATKAQRQT